MPRTSGCATSSPTTSCPTRSPRASSGTNPVSTNACTRLVTLSATTPCPPNKKQRPPPAAGAAPAGLVAEGGKISVAGTDRSITFREVARAVYAEMGRLPPDARGELAATETYDPVFGTTTSATHIAVVEIDPESYEVRVERFAVAEDCGRLVNPLIVHGQVPGGVAPGLGAALYA